LNREAAKHPKAIISPGLSEAQVVVAIPRMMLNV